jgi:hypothetical protein
MIRIDRRAIRIAVAQQQFAIAATLAASVLLNLIVMLSAQRAQVIERTLRLRRFLRRLVGPRKPMSALCQ